MEPEVESANPTDDKYEQLVMQGVEPSSAAGQLLNLFLTARFARRNQDTIWMTAFRNIRAKYGPDTQLLEGWSRAFVNMTSPKIQTAFAIITDIMLPNGKDVWDVDTTPEPYLPDFTTFLAKQNAEQGIEADYDTFKNQIFLEGQRRVRNLRKKISDGMVETAFRSVMKESIYDFAAFGNGGIFGPFPEKRVRKARGGRKADSYLYPKFEYVSLFDIYPDPGARSVQDCLYVCRRRVVNKAWISNMRSNPGFNKAILDDIIERAPDGNWTPEPWETDMIITNNNNQMYTYRHRYVVYDFWIRKTGKEMVELGCDDKEIDQDDLNKMYMANIMVCNGQVIRAVISQFHEDRIPVYLPQCRKNVHSIWGTGFAELMFDSQAAVSACERAANDTMASIARPQTVVDMSRVKMGTDSCKPHPGKIWYTNNAVGGATKPVDIFYPPNIINEVLKRQEAAHAWSDEESGIPRFLSGGGEGAHNRTLGGAELQWNNATNPFKTIISNLEEQCVIPCTEKVAEFYLTYEYSEEIDADFKIVSNGLQGLVAKMARAQGVLEIMKAVGNNKYWQSRFNDKRIGEILEDAWQIAGEQIFLNDADAMAKLKQIQEAEAQAPPALNPEIPLRDAKLKALAETDKGTPAYPIALEAVYDDLGITGPAPAAALNIMREESLTAHRQFVTAADSGALSQDVDPNGGQADVPDAKGGGMAGGAAPNGPTPPGWQPGQPGSIPPQKAPQAGPGGVVQAPLPLGVASLGTPKAESLVQHPERYAASIPPGRATNVADVGGAGLPGQGGGA